MRSGIFGLSNPKNVARCRNCNKPILFYQERICNIVEKIAYSQDGRLHQCPNEPADKDLRCYCQDSIKQRGKNKPSDDQISDSVSEAIPVVKDSISEMRFTLDNFIQRPDHLLHQVEKFQSRGGAKGPNAN
jgi:hypothetical protein